MRAAANYYALLLAVVLVTFCFGLSRLFVLRFEKGDIYPHYSSLRSDPLGAKALYRSLEAIAGMAVARGFTDPAKLERLDGTTVLMLGEGEAFFDGTGKKEPEGWERLAAAGNRLVFGFLPRTGPPRVEKGKTGGKKAPGKGEQAEAGRVGKGKGAKTGPGRDETPLPTLGERWGIAPAYFPDDGRGMSLKDTAADQAPSLPQMLPRHSRLFFRATGSDWRAVYRSGGEPVVVERRIGKGSVVLISDCYPLSNEALSREPAAPYLVWIVGGNRRVVFDEFHLGVGDTPGMGSLVRKYRLERFGAALVLLALLYVWKSSVPFLREPPPTGEERACGKDNFTGLVNLLRRTIPREKLLAACFEEWRRSFAREYRGEPERLARVEELLAREAALPPRQSDPEGAYREIAGLLAKKGKPKLMRVCRGE